MFNENGQNEQNAYRQKLKECLNLSPYLKLEVVSSASLSKGQIITINTLGLFGTNISMRERDNPG